MSDEINAIPKAYDAASVEDDIYAAWEKSGYFTPENLPDFENRKEAFSIMLPPPNVTGTLHIGHAVMLAIEDSMVRFARMNGKKALWLPGTDHAAIATQTKVEKLLIESGLKDPRRELGREVFLDHVKKFAQESHDTIVNQMKKMGASVDWSREAYTLDQDRSLAVRTAFKRMYDDGLIYRGDKVINWCPRCKSTLADDEVEHKETTAKLYTFKYDKDFPITIATTRPETKLGDTAVAVHPKDDRYKNLVGQELTAQFAGGALKLKVISDRTIDKDFGTGALGVTPAHSKIDEEMAQKNDLPFIKVIDEEGRMTKAAGANFAGMLAGDAREKVVAWLKANDLLEKEEEISQNLSICYRCSHSIEPLPKIQWFIDVNKEFIFKQSKDNPIDGIEDGSRATLKSLMQQVVRDGEIKILPERFEKTYFNWIDNLRDWNISRQIWFGHRVPVWYRSQKSKVESEKLDVGDQETEKYIMGFHQRTVQSVKEDGKTVTYRQRDHGVKEGQVFALENSQTNEIFGYGTIQKIEKTTVEDVPLNDPAHGATYNTREELIEAFQFHYPQKKITKDSPIWIYTFSFGAIEDLNDEETYVGVEAPAGDEWEQDPDTLDTWFSSGLWTFSTLGWPDKDAEDFKTYHPTTVLETGYDIIFFWVARMILMSTYLLGEVPFKTVYLHGLVRDEEGRKMSKSLGNVIDPLDTIKEFGADATRLSLLIGSTPGNDSKLSMEKIGQYRNFTNKLWNISRFIFMSVGDVESVENVEGETLADRWILGRLGEVIEAATLHHQKYELSMLGETLRDFTWNEFADWYLEIAKTQKSANTDKVLLYVLERLLALWHPFMPFVTEEIYKQFDKGMLMVAPWPKKVHDLSEDDRRAFDELRSVVVALRDFRAKTKISYSEKLHVFAEKSLPAEVLLLANAEIMQGSSRPLSYNVPIVAGSTTLYLELDDEYKARARTKLENELAEAERYMGSLEKKLSNDSFVKNAPTEIVEVEKNKLKEAKERRSNIKTELSLLK